MADNYPTEDAYMAACRALHWRTAELRFHGIEPIAIPQDASHYPPDNFDFGSKSKEKVCAHCGVTLPQHGTTCPIKVQRY